MKDVKDAPPKVKELKPEEVKTAVEQARDILQSKRGSLDDTDG